MTQYELEGPDARLSIEAKRIQSGFQITTGGKTFLLKLDRTEDPAVLVAQFTAKPVKVTLEEANTRKVTIVFGGERLTFEKPTPVIATTQATIAVKTTAKDLLVSPMPGRIISVSVKKGDDVKAGDPIAMIESMKMESVIQSDRDAVVGEVLVSEGSTVKRGQALVRYATEPS
jgi:biotin carboxyl carrier protein